MATEQYSLREELASIRLPPSIRGVLEVTYPTFTVTSGTIYPREATQTEPTITFPGAETDAEYTLIMTDPDLMMKNDSLSGQVRHWLQPGLRFNSEWRASSTQPAITAYLGPAPGLGTGNHRYFFVLTKQAQGVGESLLNNRFTIGGAEADLKDRMGFDVAEYIAETGLEVVDTFMQVGGNVASTALDVKLMTESVAHKIVGK
ncbi:PEBP-like protein [Artomyces pyxidatus]|uniref:PEBP-like protein n=1 Tax=Artomyces pyxidatus TaxID=48021 RepID=A0ACB8TFY7_9AGAM|nr:PEBP-like protein [Artomyces pyxidatus]